MLTILYFLFGRVRLAKVGPLLEADFQVQTDEVKMELPDDNNLSSALVGLEETPIGSSAKQDDISTDSILDFLNDYSDVNIDNFIDLTQAARPFNPLDQESKSTYIPPRPNQCFGVPNTMTSYNEFDQGSPFSRKHKLHVASVSGGSASKSVKIESRSNLDLSKLTPHFSGCRPKNFTNSLGHGSPQHNFTDSSHVRPTRTHTITSGDAGIGLHTNNLNYNVNTLGLECQTTLEPKPRIAFPEWQDLSGSCRSNHSYVRAPDEFRIEPSIKIGLPVNEQHRPNNLAYPQSKNNSVATRLINEINNVSYDAQQPAPAPESNFMFNQVLQMFPDIEGQFLRNICQGKNDLNEVIDIILETNNNYPKASETKITIKTSRRDPFIDNAAIGLRPNPEEGLNPNSVQPFGKTESKRVIKRNKEPEVSVIHPNEGMPNPNCKKSEDCAKPIVEIPLTSPDRAEAFTAPSNESLQLLQSLPVKKRLCLDVPEAEHSDKTTKFDFLVKIFPDAEPAFLQTKCDLGESDLSNFVSEALEKNDYPKVVIKEEKKVEEDNDLGLYTTSFDVEQFLNIFPEPFQYFFDEKRICHTNLHCLEFMKRR